MSDRESHGFHFARCCEVLVSYLSGTIFSLYESSFPDVLRLGIPHSLDYERPTSRYDAILFSHFHNLPNLLLFFILRGFSFRIHNAHYPWIILLLGCGYREEICPEIGINTAALQRLERYKRILYYTNRLEQILCAKGHRATGKDNVARNIYRIRHFATRYKAELSYTIKENRGKRREERRSWRPESPFQMYLHQCKKAKAQ
jgi:hypothetical protein